MESLKSEVRPSVPRICVSLRTLSVILSGIEFEFGIWLNIYTPMAFACNEAWKNCGKYFPMKDSGHATEKIDIDFFDF